MAIRPLWLCCLAACLVAAPVDGSRDPSALCDDAARKAARDTDTPLAVLYAITRVETGRGRSGVLHPWPWTINQAGSGAWFDTAGEAAAAAAQALATGTGNLDIGCFQLNHRWHGDQFPSLEAMFDPVTNARYAAGFLSDLHRETGDWPAAIAAYHSRSEEPAARYLAKIKTVLASLDAPADLPADAPSQRANSYPLLQPGASGRGGSLVPALAASRPLIGATP